WSRSSVRASHSSTWKRDSTVQRKSGRSSQSRIAWSRWSFCSRVTSCGDAVKPRSRCSRQTSSIDSTGSFSSGSPDGTCAAASARAPITTATAAAARALHELPFESLFRRGSAKLLPFDPAARCRRGFAYAPTGRVSAFSRLESGGRDFQNSCLHVNSDVRLFLRNSPRSRSWTCLQDAAAPGRVLFRRGSRLPRELARAGATRKREGVFDDDGRTDRARLLRRPRHVVLRAVAEGEARP